MIFSFIWKSQANQQNKEKIYAASGLSPPFFSSDFVRFLSILSPFTSVEDLYSIPPGKKPYPLLSAVTQYCESHSLPSIQENELEVLSEMMYYSDLYLLTTAQ